MDDLVAWLTRIWDQQEVQARAVLDRSAPWDGQWVNDENLALRTYNGWVLASNRGEPFAFGLIDHIVNHDPAAVLARIAADRQILAMHTGFHECPSPDDNCGWVTDDRCATLRLLAQPYADRPGFRDEWRVSS